MSTPPNFPERFNMAHYFLDARIEEGRGDHIAVIDDDGRYTYRQVQALANQVGNALSARGVGLEDRVLIGLVGRRRVRRRPSSASSRSAPSSPW